MRYERVVAVCAREWGMSPGEVREMGRTRALLFADARELMALLARGDEAERAAWRYAMPEEAAWLVRRRQAREQAANLRRMLMGAQCDDPEYLAAAIRRCDEAVRQG